MIAGGTGITPMLQIVRAVLRGRSKGDKTEINLIFANVDEKDILLREDLDSLVKQDDKLKLYYVLNNPPEGWQGGVGFVTADMIKVELCFPICSSSRLANADLGTTSTACKGREDPHLWTAAYGQRGQEGYRVAGLRQGEAGEQVGRSGLCLLSGLRRYMHSSCRRQA